jgi:ABC-type polysaccharide/polyol phosphate export permease
MWLRQLKLYFRSRARMIGSLGQPTLFLRTLGSATVALIQGSIVFLVCVAAGFRLAHPLLLPLALLFMALIAIMCTAIGTAVGSVLEDMQGFQLIKNFIVLPLFFFSSALFPVPDLPGVLEDRGLATRCSTQRAIFPCPRGGRPAAISRGDRPLPQ